MYPFLFKLSKNKIHLAIIKSLLIALVISVVAGNIHFFNLSPTKLFSSSSQTCGNKKAPSCGMACCVGKSEEVSCCSSKSNKTNSLNTESCGTSSDNLLTDQDLFLQISGSFFVDYYSAKQKEFINKEFIKSQTTPKLVPLLGKPCPCDSNGLTTQIRVDKVLILLKGNLLTRPPTLKGVFTLNKPLVLNSNTNQLCLTRAPPFIA